MISNRDDLKAPLGAIAELIAGRKFRLWKFYATMNVLLLRSPKRDVDDRNIDLVFWGVNYMSIRTSPGELHIEDGNLDDAHILETRLGYLKKGKYDRIFALAGEGCRDYIVADQVSASVNENDINETPILPDFPNYLRRGPI